MNSIDLERAMSYEPPALLIDKFCLEHKVSLADHSTRMSVSANL